MLPNLWIEFKQLDCSQIQGKHICVALSGGVDSVVLLHLLHRLREDLQIQLSAVHVHHGLNREADNWVTFCKQLCADWHIPLAIEYVKIDAKNLGIEAAARQQRYAVFSQQNADILALAHHADDQLETFCLGFLRGGGLRALSAMPVWREISISNNQNSEKKIDLWRPLLSFPRTQIEEYAQQQQLNWVEDSSNQDTDFLRNWLRQELLPAITARVPKAEAQMQATITQLQDELGLLDEIVHADEEMIYQTGQFQIAPWLTLSTLRRRQQLCRFAQKYDLGTPSKHSVINFEHILQTAEMAEWSLPHGHAILYRGMLLAIPNNLQQKWQWIKQPFSGSLEHVWRQLGLAQMDFAEQIKQYFVEVRAANQKDILHLPFGRKSVWKLLQEQGIPPAIRQLWPVLLNQKGECLAIFNIRCAAEWSVLPVIAELENYRFQKDI